MWGAAPRRNRILPAFALALGIAPGAAAANTAAKAAQHAPVPARTWAVQVDSPDLAWLDRGHVASLRKAGINTLVVDRRQTGAMAMSQLRNRAVTLGLTLSLIDTARGTMEGRASVAVRRQPNAVAASRDGTFASAHARVMLVVPLVGRFSPSAWRETILETIAHERDLAVATASTSAQRYAALAPFLSLLASIDKLPPTRPGRLRVVGQSSSTVRIAWSPATDQSRLRYRVLRNGKTMTTVAALSARVARPNCSTNFAISVVAVDAAGNRSPAVTTRVSCVTKSIAGTTPAGAAPTADALPPAPVLGLAISATTSTSISIGWTPSTDNVGVAGYSVYRTDVAVATTVGTTFTHVALACGTSYRLAVVAFDDAGNRSAPTSITATTGVCGGGGGGGGGGVPTDTQAPTAPGGLATTQVLTTSITLIWLPATDNVAVTGYGAYRGGSLASTTSGTTFTFGSLTCGTTYIFAVDAFDAAANRSTKSTRAATTASCPTGGDTQAPTTPMGLAVSSRTTTSVTLSWNPSSDDQALAGYGVYRNGASVGYSATTSTTISGLTCGTSYPVGVDAFDSTGNRSAQAAITASTSACPDTTPPSTPGSLTVTATAATSISLSWSTAIDNVGVTGYRLLRNGSAVGTAALTTYTFTSLLCNATYTLAVDAFDAAGNHSTAMSLSATTAACPDSTPPSAPGSVTESTSTTTSVSLAWSPSSDNVGVTGYDVSVNGTKAGTTTGTSYTASSLTCGKSYTLGVVAFDATGNRSGQVSISASTSACAAGDAANVWVDTSGGSCARQASAGAYVDAQACGDLDSAYQAAAAGDTVRIKGGSYGNQTINVKSGAASPNRVFLPASGEAVSFRDVIEEDADYITLQGPMTLHRLDLTATQNAVVDGLTIAYNYTDKDQPVVFVGGKSTGGRNSNGTVIRNSDISGAWDQKNVLIASNGGTVNDVTLDHDDIHSQKQSDDSVHMECLWITDTNGITVKNSRFWGCHSTGDVIIAKFSENYGVNNLLFQNNVFEQSYRAGTDECCNPGYYTIQTTAIDASTWTFEYNVLENGIIYQPGMTVRGNIGWGGSCASGVTYSHNLWTDVDCGTDTRNSAALAPAQFINSATHDWRPSGPSAPQVGAGDPASYPTTDADNQPRTGTSPDAGPYTSHP